MASTLPTPNNCCSSCNDSVVVPSTSGVGGTLVQAGAPPNPIPSSYTSYFDSSTGALYFRDPTTGAPIPAIGP